MKVQEELEEAQKWHDLQPVSMHEHFSQLVSALVGSFYGKDDGTLISKLGQIVRKKLGMTAHFVLSDREMVQKCLSQNALLFFYRLFGTEQAEKKTEFLLRLFESFFSYFRKFLDHALSKTRKQIELDPEEAFKVAEHVLRALETILFPHGAESIVMPELPSMFQRMAGAYVQEAYQKGLASIHSYVTELLLNQKQKEQLFIHSILLLHSWLLGVEKKPSFEKIDTNEVSHLQNRAEAVVEQFYFCLAEDSAKAVRFCPKYKGSMLLLSGLMWTSRVWHLKGACLCIRGITFLMNKKKHEMPIVGWAKMEDRITDKAHYEVLFTRFAEQKMERFSALPLQLLVQGAMSYLIQAKLEDFPWEEKFQALLFGVRRIRNFLLSKEGISFLKNI